MSKEIARGEILKLLSTIGNSVEEILSWVAECPSLGNNGVGESMVTMENIVSLARHRVEVN